MNDQITRFMGKTAYDMLQSAYPKLNEATELKEWCQPLSRGLTAVERVGYLSILKPTHLRDLVDSHGIVNLECKVNHETRVLKFQLWGTGNRNQSWLLSYDPIDNVLWYQWT